MTNFAAAAEAFYSTTESWAQFGASDTEPRAEFAQVVIALYDGHTPVIPQGAEAWQLFSGMRGSGLAAVALSRATYRVVEAGKTDRPGLVEFVKAQGWG